MNLSCNSADLQTKPNYFTSIRCNRRNYGRNRILVLKSCPNVVEWIDLKKKIDDWKNGRVLMCDAKFKLKPQISFSHWIFPFENQILAENASLSKERQEEKNVPLANQQHRPIIVWAWESNQLNGEEEENKKLQITHQMSDWREKCWLRNGQFDRTRITNRFDGLQSIKQQIIFDLLAQHGQSHIEMPQRNSLSTIDWNYRNAPENHFFG